MEFNWLTDDGRKFLQRGYLLPGQSAENRIRQIAEKAENYLGIKGYSEKFYRYFSKGWFSLSTPIWSNYGLDRGLGISCFSSVIDDCMESILYTVAEVGMMTKFGGGTSAYFGKIRGRGQYVMNNGKTDGSFSFFKLFDSLIDTISQGTVRKGQFAGYIDIEHPDIEEWLDTQLEGNPVQLIYYGVCVGNQWLEEMENGDKEKRSLWAKVLKCRIEIGIPYIFFRDNANKNKPEVYENLPIYGSNLCSEIMLPASPKESFVCCLSSMNLLHFEDWKDTDAVHTMIFFLDTVITEFIEKTQDTSFMERANRFAKRHRALGLGVVGWHGYLQSKMVSFDSMDAMELNNNVFKIIREQADRASALLAEMFEEPEILKGLGRRNTTLMAIAPTKSSSFILGQVSQGIEPIKSNYFVKDLAKLKSSYKNPFLLELLESKNKNTPEIWLSILQKDGSVQHLEFLSDHQKNVFRTFSEIDQISILKQAAQRQQYIDQGQSLNLMIHPKTPIKDINSLYLTAAKLGIKSLYYQHSVNAAQEFMRNLAICDRCEA